jgi:hypothetical protein
MKDPLYDIKDRYSPSVIIPEYNDYTGTVLPNPPWLGSDYFCLSTDIPDSPIRMLYKDNIICGWLNPSDKEEEINYVVIPKNGKNYTVSMDNRGHLSCNCTGFGYRRSCSHVKEVMAA